MFSVIFTGMSAAHASGPMMGGHGHHAAMAHSADAHDGRHHAASAYNNMHCQDHPNMSDSIPPSKKGDTGGCCHSAYNPSITVRDVFDVAKYGFHAARLTPHRERIAVSVTAEAPLRPPRARV